MADRAVLLGLLLIVALSPPLVLWVGLRLLPAAMTAVAERRRRRPPPGPSLETAVADLRRLRRELRVDPPTQVRRLAVLDAYDHSLVEVCGVVGVDAPLTGASGTERPFARLLTEAELEAAGIALDEPPGRAGPA